MQAEIKNITDIKNYITARQPVFTLVGQSDRYTYRMKQCEDRGNFWFMYSLCGPDNTQNYRYIGCMYINVENKFRFKNFPKNDGPAARAARWFVNRINIDRPMKTCQFLHSGKCSRCGRLLTTPESIQKGLGPVCASKAPY